MARIRDERTLYLETSTTETDVEEEEEEEEPYYEEEEGFVPYRLADNPAGI